MTTTLTRSAAHGVAAASGLASIACSIGAIRGRSSVASADRADQFVLAIGVTSLLVIGLCVVVAATDTVLASRGRRVSRLSVVWPIGWVVGVGAIALCVVLTQLAARRPTVSALDVGASVVLAASSGACALVAAVAVAIAALGRGDDTTGGRTAGRTGLAAALVTAVVVVAVVSTFSASSRSMVVDGPAEVGAVAVPAEVTGLDKVGFRLRLSDDRPYVAPLGAGFVVVSSGVFAAYDGANGNIRWTYDPDFEVGSYRAFGSGDESTLVIVGESLSIGLDGLTGRLLWRSADVAFGRRNDQNPSVHETTPVGARGPRLRATNPRTGQIVLDEQLACLVVAGSSDRQMLRTSCDSRDRVVLTDLRTGQSRDVPTLSAGEAVEEIYALGNGFFALATVDRDTRDTVTVRVVDTSIAQVVDTFRTTRYPVSASASGLVALSGDRDDRQNVSNSVEFRDVRARRTVRVRVGGAHELEPTSGVWWAEQFVVPDYSGEVVVIDPRANAATRRGKLCTPIWRSSRVVTPLFSGPGAFVVRCSSVVEVPFAAEIVGLH